MPWCFTNNWVSYQGNKTMYQSNIVYLFYSIGTMTEKQQMHITHTDVKLRGPSQVHLSNVNHGVLFQVTTLS